MIEWLTLKDVTEELGFKDTRTFKDNYLEKYPPDREQGRRKWWKRSTVERIKEAEFAEETDEEGA